MFNKISIFLVIVTGIILITLTISNNLTPNIINQSFATTNSLSDKQQQPPPQEQPSLSTSTSNSIDDANKQTKEATTITGSDSALKKPTQNKNLDTSTNGGMN